VGACSRGESGDALAPRTGPTAEEGHLWDTEDPAAALAPPLGLVLLALILAIVVIRRVVQSRPAGSPVLERAQLRSEGRTGMRFSFSQSSRARFVLRHLARPDDFAGARPWASAARFPPGISERRLVATLERIANDPSAYASGVIPEAPEIYVAEACLTRHDGRRTAAHVVVEVPGLEILAAYPSGSRDAARPGSVESLQVREEPTAESSYGPHGEVREALAEAIAALPPPGVVAAALRGRHPSSAATLPRVSELLEQTEWEAALFALVETARAVPAGLACRAALDRAARALGCPMPEWGSEPPK
jgi:hypothetical protein